MSTTESKGSGPLMNAAERLRHELDRLFETAISQGERALDAFGLREGATWVPPVDLVESPTGIQVVVDVPGVDPSAIDITLAGNMLTIEGEKPSTEADNEEVVHMRHRGGGRFKRSIPMPVSVDPEGVSAESKHGVLTVRLRKTEQSRPHKVTVNVADRGPGQQSDPGPDQTGAGM